MGCFADLDDSMVEDIMTINALHATYLAKALVNQQLARSKKSALVVTSSTFGQRPTGGASIVYSATKSLASFLAIGLSYELEGKVDVLAWECGEVATKMTKKRPGGLVLGPHDAVRAMLRDIGRDRVTNGDATHDFTNRLLQWVPLYYANKFFIGIGSKVLKKQRARAPQAPGLAEKKKN